MITVNGDEFKGFNTGYGFTDFYYVLTDSFLKEGFKVTDVSLLLLT